MPPPNREFLLQLVNDARIKGPQLDETVGRELDADYWRSLTRGCDLASAEHSIKAAIEDPRAIDEAILGNERDGYFRLPGLVATADVRRISAAIDAVTAAGWPAPFAFVYDEPWLAARLTASNRVLESARGSG